MFTAYFIIMLLIASGFSSPITHYLERRFITYDREQR